jgi:hypothetical protein
MKTFIGQIPQELLDDIKRGDCVPIVGAGLSLNAVLPTACKMPLWNDLGVEIAKRLNKTFSGDAMSELSEYCAKCSKFELIRLLRECLHIRTAKPGPVHTEFARLPFPEVLTTNFDFLLERAYEGVGKSYLPVVDEDLLTFGRTDGETRILKMHGDLHHPSLMVVTEEDYDQFSKQRERMFQEVTHLLSRYSVLFLGYSINDPDFRQIWSLVKTYFREFRRPAYALLVDASNDQIEVYKRRGVTRVISLPGESMSYGEVLSTAFQEIGREM